ncbi:MAG: hypothetical protein WC343_09790, partial [Bacilli bacterium]
KRFTSNKSTLKTTKPVKGFNKGNNQSNNSKNWYGQSFKNSNRKFAPNTKTTKFYNRTGEK